MAHRLTPHPNCINFPTLVWKGPTPGQISSTNSVGVVYVSAMGVKSWWVSLRVGTSAVLLVAGIAPSTGAAGHLGSISPVSVVFAANGPVSVVFAANGQAVQNWSVPDGVGSVAYDAAGGDNGPGKGGYAGRVQGTMAVVPGQVLDLWVGLQATGSNSGSPGAGGWGGRNGMRHGGNGGTGTTSGGVGGGGATEIDIESGSNPTVVAVAGGGGGSAGSSLTGCGAIGAGGCGAVISTGDGGAGQNGLNSGLPGGLPLGGGGGSPTGGSGGTISAYPDRSGGAGGDASIGAGGVGANGGYSAGGGGGGGYGGGGGGAGSINSPSTVGGGGGAGASFGSGAVFSQAPVGAGVVTLTYTVVSAPAGATQFVPLVPSRLLDTRNSSDITGGLAVPAGGGIDVQITGRGGVPSTGVSAVVLNVTAAAAAAPGYVTVWPSGKPKPIASNLNVTASGQNIANLVTVRVGLAGKVSLYSEAGTHLIADIAGYYVPVPAGTSAGRYTALTPARILDTRLAIGVPGTIPIPAGNAIDVAVSGQGGVPATGVSAVVLNVTAADALTPGFVTVWPTGVARPIASSLNVTAMGQNIANLVIVPIGTSGRISLFAQGGTHLLADVEGWFGDQSQPVSASGLFEPLDPARVLDTRLAVGIPTTTAVPALQSIAVHVLGTGGVPTVNVSAVVLNMTAADATAPGFVTV